MSVDQFLLSADTTDLNLPEIRPTLNLNFARVKSLDPRITFTRNSGGSYFGADGFMKYAGINEARFDHDPETRESLGLLIEESRTNLIANSSNFLTAWGRSRVEFLNINTADTLAPDGTYTAAKLIPTSVFGRHHPNRGFIYTAGVTYTYSVFVKAAGNDKIMLRLFINGVAYKPDRGTVGGVQAFFNLTTGEITSQDANVTGRIQDVGNGWYRCSVTSTATNTAADGVSLVFLLDDSYEILFAGDNTNRGIYVWGPQLELGEFPTSYIPTIATTRTRVSEQVSIIGNDFLDFFNENEGVFYSKSKSFGTQTQFVGEVNTIPVSLIAYIDILRYQNGRIRAAICPGIRDDCVIAESSLVLGPVYKSTHAYNLNKSILFVDGNRIGGINSRDRIVPENTGLLTIGNNRPNGPFIFNGHIYHLMYYNKLLTEDQLQALTF
jgi:hypothetical protein